METEKAISNLPPQSTNGQPLQVDTFFDYGNEVQEIISARPPNIVRWGTVYFSLLLLLLIAASWFIKYPDIVKAPATLNSVNPPQQVLARTDGKLVAILVSENQMVTKGQSLGYLESVASPDAVIALENRIGNIDDLISQNRTDEIVQFLPSVSASPSSSNDLGEIQTAFQTFSQAFITFRDFIDHGFYLKKKNLLGVDLKNLKKLHGILLGQKNLMEHDLALSNKTFSMNQSLADQKVISPLDFRKAESELIGKKLTLPQINASIVANEGIQNDKLKEIADLENQILTEKNTFIQALQTMKSEIAKWKYKYVLKASVAGQVSFTGFLQENEEVKNGASVFYVRPDNSSYYVEAVIPQHNSGKVKNGQKVLLKFQAYPYAQYGLLSGRVDFIKSVPGDSGYLAKITLPKGLTTNYGTTITYRDGLIAEADIVTDDMRLLERFFYESRKLFSR